MVYDDGLRQYTTNKPFEGVLPNLQRRYQETDSNRIKEDLGKYQTISSCTECNGDRLKPAALAVKISVKTISEVTQMSIAETVVWFEALPKQLTQKQIDISGRILKEINAVSYTHLTLPTTPYV